MLKVFHGFILVDRLVCLLLLTLYLDTKAEISGVDYGGKENPID